MRQFNHVFTFWIQNVYVLDPESSQSLTSRRRQFPLPLPSDLAISIRTPIFSSPILVLETQNLEPSRTNLSVSDGNGRRDGDSDGDGGDGQRGVTAMDGATATRRQGTA